MSEQNDNEVKQDLFKMGGVTVDISRSDLLSLNQRVLESVRRMTPQEGMESFIKSGIYTPDGKLSKEYGG